MSEKSLYVAAGSPTHCFNPNCKKPFDGSCFRGDDDKYYCSELCANEGFDDTVVPIESAWRKSRTIAERIALHEPEGAYAVPKDFRPGAK